MTLHELFLIILTLIMNILESIVSKCCPCLDKQTVERNNTDDDVSISLNCESNCCTNPRPIRETTKKIKTKSESKDV